MSGAWKYIVGSAIPLLQDAAERNSSFTIELKTTMRMLLKPTSFSFPIIHIIIQQTLANVPIAKACWGKLV